MTPEEIKEFCLSKPHAVETYPFGDRPICYKVGGKIFAQLYENRITLKCTAFSSQTFRAAYPGIVVRGYHCPPVQQPYWNTIDLERFPHEKLPMMIDHAYETVICSFPKRKQQLFRSETLSD